MPATGVWEHTTIITGYTGTFYEQFNDHLKCHSIAWRELYALVQAAATNISKYNIFDTDCFANLNVIIAGKNT